MDKQRLIWVRKLLKDNAPAVYQRFAAKRLYNTKQIEDKKGGPLLKTVL